MLPHGEWTTFGDMAPKFRTSASRSRVGCLLTVGGRKNIHFGTSESAQRRTCYVHSQGRSRHWKEELTATAVLKHKDYHRNETRDQ
jgi:hypothetical protein